METTIDVKGLPEDRIEYLKNIVGTFGPTCGSRNSE